MNTVNNGRKSEELGIATLANAVRRNDAPKKYKRKYPIPLSQAQTKIVLLHTHDLCKAKGAGQSFVGGIMEGFIQLLGVKPVQYIKVVHIKAIVTLR